MIPAGTPLDFTVRGTTEAAQFQLVFTEAMLTAEASQILGRSVDIVSLAVRAEGTVVTGTLPWGYRADVRVVTRVAYAKTEDVGSIVANAFGRAAGNMPIVTTGRALDFEAPELSWKVVIGIAAVGLLVVALKVG